MGASARPPMVARPGIAAALAVVYCNHFGCAAAQSYRSLTELRSAVRCKKVALHTGYGPQEGNKR